VQSISGRPRVTVTADGQGVVSHVGARLLADLAAVTGLDTGFSDAGGSRRRRSAHDPGSVLTDLAVMLADGGEAISDLGVLREQPSLFGPVASAPTAWRVLEQAARAGSLPSLRAARAAARERAWLARAELGRPMPQVKAGGQAWKGLVIDIDATLVTCHSEKESAAATFKGGFGYHPLLAFLDNTDEALAGILRPGNAGSNTAADHIAITGLALAQLPDHERHGQPILIRADGAGASKAWLNHLAGLREGQHLDLDYSVGFTMTEQVQQAILALPAWAWRPAVQVDGGLRDGADVAELTGVLAAYGLDLTANGWPAGLRVIVRRERPHPGAQLTFSDVHGYRFQTFATNTRVGQLAALEARHRAHARVEDRIRCGKDTGYGRFPSRHFPINQVWLELALTAADLIAWAQTMLLDGDLALAEPKALRYRLLHVAARITRGQRRVWIRLQASWPWARPLAAAFDRLRAIPPPVPA
jgi:hypothetical protein